MLEEDDDLDAMINDLKQKTSGRDMHKMVQDIEGERPKPYYRVFDMFSHTLNFALWKNGSSYNRLYKTSNVFLYHIHIC